MISAIIAGSSVMLILFQNFDVVGPVATQPATPTLPAENSPGSYDALLYNVILSSQSRTNLTESNQLVVGFYQAATAAHNAGIDSLTINAAYKSFNTAYSVSVIDNTPAQNITIALSNLAAATALVEMTATSNGTVLIPQSITQRNQAVLQLADAMDHVSVLAAATTNAAPTQVASQSSTSFTSLTGGTGGMVSFPPTSTSTSASPSSTGAGSTTDAGSMTATSNDSAGSDSSWSPGLLGVLQGNDQMLASALRQTEAGMAAEQRLQENLVAQGVALQQYGQRQFDANIAAYNASMAFVNTAQANAAAIAANGAGVIAGAVAQEMYRQQKLLMQVRYWPKSLVLQLSSTNFCLDMGNAQNAGQPVVQKTCDGSPSQRWITYNNQYISMANPSLCLEIRDGDGVPGHILQTNLCSWPTPNPDQTLTIAYDAARDLWSTGLISQLGLCVDFDSSQRYDGGRVQFAPCRDVSSQLISRAALVDNDLGSVAAVNAGRRAQTAAQAAAEAAARQQAERDALVAFMNRPYTAAQKQALLDSGNAYQAQQLGRPLTPEEIAYNATHTVFGNESTPYTWASWSVVGTDLHGGTVYTGPDPTACTLIGAGSPLVFASGRTVTAFKDAYGDFDHPCQSEQRTCSSSGFTNGSFQHAGCESFSPLSCALTSTRGTTIIPHGKTITVYQQPSVSGDALCQAEQRTCSNGKILSGSYTYTTCTDGMDQVLASVNSRAPASVPSSGCYGSPIDKPIVDGEVLVAFDSYSGNDCVGHQVACVGGTRVGTTNYRFGYCRRGRTAPTKVTTNGVTASSWTPTAYCALEGLLVKSGTQITAFRNPVSDPGKPCESEKRVCIAGQFISGSYAYGYCKPTPASVPALTNQKCMFGSTSVISGTTVTAYKTSSVALGQRCQSEQRTCVNGKFSSGSFAFDFCDDETWAASKLLQSSEVGAQCFTTEGGSLYSGGSNLLYKNSLVKAGGVCESETRVCANGKFTAGSFGSPTCRIAADCNLAGKTIADGTSLQGFTAATATYPTSCAAATLTCNSGQLGGVSNTSQFSTTCQQIGKPCSFGGKTIADRGTVVGYPKASVNSPDTCMGATLTCSNGILSGVTANPSASCQQVNKPCAANGWTMASGATRTVYAAANVAFGQTCRPETITCQNGVLSGNITYTSSACTAATSVNCSYRGYALNNGASMTVFASATVPSGQTCQSGAVTCTNGLVSGNTTYPATSCSVSAAKSCTFNGLTVRDGGTVTGYPVTTATYPASCKGVTLTCSNGVLPGADVNPAATCVNKAQPCKLGTMLVADHGTATVYLTGSAVSPKTCMSSPATCNNGTLSAYAAPGFALYPSCTQTYRSCTLDGVTIAHGNSMNAFQVKTTTGSCTSHRVLCNDGTLSEFGAAGPAAYPYASCTMAAKTVTSTVVDPTTKVASPITSTQPAVTYANTSWTVCLFNGKTTLTGQTTTAYASSAVAYPAMCQPVALACSSGRWTNLTPGVSASCTQTGAPVTSAN